jgi:hypothetical protein
MRNQFTRPNELHVSVSLVSAGAGLTGLSPSCRIQRRSDDAWFTGAGWGATTALAMTEVSAANLAGFYEYEVDPVYLDAEDGAEGYRVVITEATTTFREHVDISVAQSMADLLEESMSPYETQGTLGNHLNRILRLRQENTHVVYTAWSSNGQPTEGYVLTYASAADLNSDADPWPLAKSRHDFVATYDGSLQLTDYTSVRTT